MEQQKQQERAPEVLSQVVKSTETVEYLMSPIGQMVKEFELTQRMAMVYAESSIVPQAYRGKANIGNVIIAIDMARRMRINPLQCMQNLYVVHGNVGWSSKFLIAMFNSCGRFTPIEYEFFGDPGKDIFGCRAFSYNVTDREHKYRLAGPIITIGLAKKEGWYEKNGSKWQTIPELMLRYRSAAWLINTTAPELSMGIATSEEIEDAIEVPYEDVQTQQTRRVSFNGTEANITPVNDAPPAGTAEEEPVEAKPTDNDAKQETKAQPKKVNRNDLFG